MLIEIYKGIAINHRADIDEFYTDVINSIIRDKPNVIKAKRLQKIRDEIDIFISVNGYTPIVKKVWYRQNNNELFKLTDVLLYNAITKQAEIKREGNTNLIVNMANNMYSTNSGRNANAYIQCEENDAIIKMLNEKQEQINKINSEISCSTGKLIPLKPEHFKLNINNYG